MHGGHHESPPSLARRQDDISSHSSQRGREIDNQIPIRTSSLLYDARAVPSPYGDAWQRLVGESTARCVAPLHAPASQAVCHLQLDKHVPAISPRFDTYDLMFVFFINLYIYISREYVLHRSVFILIHPLKLLSY
jgi:hypothetical protein